MFHQNHLQRNATSQKHLQHWPKQVQHRASLGTIILHPTLNLWKTLTLQGFCPIISVPAIMNHASETRIFPGALMPRGLIISALILLIITGCAHRELRLNEPNGADLFIMQGNKPVALAADGSLLYLKPEPFVFVTRFPKVNICLSSTPKDLEFVKAGIDTTREKRSCFFVWDFYAMDGNADYLILGGEGANSLNTDHGMRVMQERLYAFTVRSLFVAATRRHLKLSDVRKPIHAAIWIDRNWDLVIDDGEFRLIDLVFSSTTTPPL
jgi:hypothetical protein